MMTEVGAVCAVWDEIDDTINARYGDIYTMYYIYICDSGGVGKVGNSTVVWQRLLHLAGLVVAATLWQPIYSWFGIALDGAFFLYIRQPRATGARAESSALIAA